MIRRLALLAPIASALLGCGTDCDDAAGKLEFCELVVPTTLAADCDDEGALACQARCVRDTSCAQLAQSIGGTESAFDQCAAACGATDLFAGLNDEPSDGDGGTDGSGGAGGASNAEQ